MKTLIALFIACNLLSALPALAAELLIIQSSRHSAYNEVLKGFRSACTEKGRLVVLEDYSEVDLLRVVREEQPAVIVTIGESAFAAARKVRRIPVISLMSLGFSSGHNIPANVTGVRMTVSPERYMSLFKAMQLNRVGVIYNPAHSGAYLRRARNAAERYGIELVQREVRNPRQTPQQLAVLTGAVDSLWLLPDPTAMAKETMDAYFLFAMDHGKPIISFAETYLSLGAAAVLEIDRYAVGRQGGEMGARLLHGTPVAEVVIEDPRVTSLKTNQSVMRKIGIAASILDRLASERQD